MRKISK